jgi:cell division protease FtsH
MLITDSEKEIIAYHEAGHAILGLLTGTDSVHKVTIIPRGRALGLTMQLPTEEKHIHSTEYWMNQIKMLFGGHLAEQIIFKDITTGSSNDISRATDIARKMVTEWGMSEKIGPIAFGQKNEQIFLGREISQHKDYSESTARMIDQEVNRIITDCLEGAKKMIMDNFNKFESLAKYLIERESLNAEEILTIFRGEKLQPMAAVKTNVKGSEITE